jgi:hypothetical protein
MKLVELSEIKNIADYELERPALRERIIEMKERRRVSVGDHVTFLFENRDTVRYQVQEMMRIERLVKAADVEHELATFNELIPGPGELSATMLVEYPTPEERDLELRRLLGLENHVWLYVADTAPIKARFDTRQIATDRISAVQYVRFVLTLEHRSRWLGGARIVIDHPLYSCEQVLSPVQLADLAADWSEGA